MQVASPLIVEAVTAPGLPRADIDSTWLTGKSTDEVLSEHLDNVRSALLKRDRSGVRSPTLLRQRSRTELLYETVKDHPRAPSSQSFLFLSNAIRNPDRVEQVKQEQRRSTIRFLESHAAQSSRNGLAQRDVLGAPRRLQLAETEHTQLSSALQSVPQQLDTNLSDFHSLYNPQVQPLELNQDVNAKHNEAVETQRAAALLSGKKIKEHKATYSKCKSLVGHLRHPENRTLPSEYDQLFGGTRQKLVADGRHSVAEFKRAASGRESRSNEPDEDVEVRARSTSASTQSRGMYFVLDKTGRSQKRAIASAARIQVGRNGQPVYDENLSVMLAASVLLKKDRASLKGALDALKQEELSYAPPNLSWKSELANTTGKVFDLNILEQRKAAARAKEQTEPTRFATESPRRDIRLDLNNASHVIESNSRLAFPLTRVDTLPKSNATIPTSTYVPIPPGAPPPPTEPRPAVAMAVRKPPAEPTLMQTHHIRVRTPQQVATKDATRRPKVHRVRQPLFETLAPPSLNLTGEQWRNYVLNPGPVASHVPLPEQTQKRSVEFTPRRTRRTRTHSEDVSPRRLNVVQISLPVVPPPPPADSDATYQPAPLGASASRVQSGRSSRKGNASASPGFRVMSARSIVSPSRQKPDANFENSSFVQGYGIPTPIASAYANVNVNARRSAALPLKFTFITQPTPPQPPASGTDNQPSRATSAKQRSVTPLSTTIVELATDVHSDVAQPPDRDAGASYTPAPPGSVRSDDEPYVPRARQLPRPNNEQSPVNEPEVADNSSTLPVSVVHIDLSIPKADFNEVESARPDDSDPTGAPESQ